MSDLDKIYKILLENGIVDEKDKIWSKENFLGEGSMYISFDENGDIKTIGFECFQVARAILLTICLHFGIDFLFCKIYNIYVR